LEVKLDQQAQRLREEHEQESLRRQQCADAALKECVQAVQAEADAKLQELQHGALGEQRRLKKVFLLRLWNML
jgi:deoxycytidylate deaminase